MGSFWSTESPAPASESVASSTGNPAGDPAQPPTTSIGRVKTENTMKRKNPINHVTSKAYDDENGWMILQGNNTKVNNKRKHDSTINPINATASSRSPSLSSHSNTINPINATASSRSHSSSLHSNTINPINATASSRSPSSSSHSNTIIDLTTNDSDDEIAAGTNQAKRQKVVEEKRKTPWINHASGKTIARISRALSQRMYLINQQDDSTADNLSRTYAVLGSTGNVYNVKIDSLPSCTCPDSFPCCKHILFVFLRVLKLPRHSPFIYQNSLLQSDLRYIFTHSVTNPSDVLANQAVIEAFNRKTEDGAGESEAERKRLPDWEPGAECPICFEDLVEGKKDEMVACVTCRKYIHTECISAWEVACKKPTTCPLCRQIWRRYGESEGSARVEAGEGYVNLAVEQGLPHYRVGFRRRYY